MWFWKKKVILLGLILIILALIVPLSLPVSADTIVSPDGWGWQNPLPQGNQLFGVWAGSSSDVFAVGYIGTIIHYNGSSWSAMKSDTTNYLAVTGVWGSSSSDVFAVGTYTILHYNGISWSAMSGGSGKTLHGVWGTSSSDVFAVGSSGTILHYNGSAWNPMTSGTSAQLMQVWGTSPSDVFAVGYSVGGSGNGVILHYDGSSWSPMSESTTQPLWDIWGSSPSDVFAAGSEDIFHYDGNDWSAMNSGYSMQGIWGSSSSDIFAIGGNTIIHYDGSVWTSMDSGVTSPSNGGLRYVHGTSGSDVFAVGDGGTIVHYDGSTWTEMSSGPKIDLGDVWGNSPSDVFAVGARGHGTIVHYDGSFWTEMSTTGTLDSLQGVWGSSPANVFAVGYGWNVGPDYSTILHYDGSSWSGMTSGSANALYDIWGSSASDVFAVGWSGTILHYDGASWNAMSSGTTNWLRAVWGSSASDVFAVGWSGTILHYDGNAWSSMSSGTTENSLYGVWGSSASDVFAVGSSGTILHYDGNTWSSMTSSTSYDLNGVWGSSSSDIFAVGTYTILHYDGTSWSVMSSGPVWFLGGVWGTSSSDVFAVGRNGMVIHYQEYGSPTVAAVSPNRGQQGETIDVTISGTYFTGVTSVGFGSGITISNIIEDSSNQITAGITIDSAATLGPRDVSVTTPGGTATLTDGFTIVHNQIPNQPNNQAPANEATSLSLTPTLQSSAFSDPDVGDTHAASQWEITTTPGDYSPSVFDSGTDAVNLTNITIPGGTLSESTTYYWHVRHQDNHGAWSDWSLETNFLTVTDGSGTTWYVNPGESIQAAVDAASSGDTIMVEDGTYIEHLELNKQLTLIGIGYPVVDGNGAASTITISADEVTLRGFTVINCGGYWDAPPAGGIQLNNAQRCYITDNEVHDNNANGIALVNSNHNTVIGNICWGNVNGIYMWSQSPLTSSNNTLQDNACYQNTRYGIYLWSYVFLTYTTQDNELISNNCYLNNLGGIYIGKSPDNIIAENSCYNNGNYGIRLWAGDPWMGGGQGEYTEGNIVTKNTVSNNSRGIDLYRSRNNTIYLNNLMENSVCNVYSNKSTNSWNSPDEITYSYGGASYTNYLGNYYSDYIGGDVNGDGIGDDPLFIDIDSDDYPLMGPFLNGTISKPPNQPDNISPANGATDVSFNPTLISSAFSDPDVGDTHAASQWQITTTSGDYSSAIYDSDTDAVNLTNITIPGGGALSEATTYYWHVRHQDNRGDWSDWSLETYFVTELLTTAPQVQTNNATNIYASSATLNGYLDNLGTASVVGVYFEWATDSYYTTHNSSYSNETTPPLFMTSPGPVVSALISLLTPDTTYHYRAKAVGDGTAYGGDVTFTTTGVSNDGDGVPDNVEDSAPNGGDGNYDGIPDSQQGNVASFPNAKDGSYVTVESPSGTNLENVAAVDENTLPTIGKPNINFPFGFFAFDITGLALGEEIELTLTLANSVAQGTQYWKYGPTPSNHAPHWYQIDMGSDDGDNVITITLQDGGLGDDWWIADTVIVDQGGPGWGPAGSATGVPVFPTWYIGIIAALGAGVLAYLYRRRVLGRKTTEI